MPLKLDMDVFLIEETALGYCFSIDKDTQTVVGYQSTETKAVSITSNKQDAVE